MIDDLLNLAIDAALAAAAFMIIRWAWNKIRRKRIWIIDDSKTDILLYKMNFDFQGCDVTYFSSARNLDLKMCAVNMPDAVIIDYKLQDHVDGDRVVKMCQRNDIPAILITAYDGDIATINTDLIYRKSAEPVFYRSIESWVHRVTA